MFAFAAMLIISEQTWRRRIIMLQLWKMRRKRMTRISLSRISFTMMSLFKILLWRITMPKRPLKMKLRERSWTPAFSFLELSSPSSFWSLFASTGDRDWSEPSKLNRNKNWKFIHYLEYSIKYNWAMVFPLWSRYFCLLDLLYGSLRGVRIDLKLQKKELKMHSVD